jgi:hypothetical protein
MATPAQWQTVETRNARRRRLDHQNVHIIPKVFFFKLSLHPPTTALAAIVRASVQRSPSVYTVLSNASVATVYTVPVINI